MWGLGLGSGSGSSDTVVRVLWGIDTDLGSERGSVMPIWLCWASHLFQQGSHILVDPLEGVLCLHAVVWSSISVNLDL